MRKTLLALSLALALPAAFAQGAATSSVELYGIVDIGFENVDNGAVSANRITSGLSTGSRWGLRGREDLGGGYQAIFTLESRIEIDTGQVNNQGPIYYCGSPQAACPGVVLLPPATLLPAPNQAAILGGSSAVNAALLAAVSEVNGAKTLFDRQAFAGLITPYGAVLAGRQYTPGYEILIKYNSFADSFAGNPGHLSALNIRANNALAYRAELKGFVLSVMYGFGGTDGNRNERTSGPTRGDDFFGANVQYNTPMFGVAVGYNRSNTVTFAAPNDSRKGLETINVGGTLNVGPAKIFAQYHKAKNENPVLRPEDVQGLIISTNGSLAAITGILGTQYINRFDVDAMRGVAGPIDLDVYHLGLQYPLGNGTLHLAYNHAKDTARSAWATADATVDSYGLAYFYNLSKRSQLYAAAALANNKDQARIALGAACCVGGWTTARGEDSRVIQVGMRHTF